METHLGREMELSAFARAEAVSAAHLIRAFRQRTGLSPIAYFRARKLSEAAKALATGRGDILNIALDTGYGSHEAFTRAFTAQFGCPPSAVRSPDTLATLTLTEPLTMTDPDPIPLAPPTIKTREAFHVTGIDGAFKFSTIPEIPALWAKLNAREDEIEAAEAGLAFGICHGQGEDGFRYLAGFPTVRGASVPNGMARLAIPAGRYAVFEHKGHVTELHRTMQAIFDRGLTDAGLTTRDGPELEVYDKRFDPKTGRGTVEIWIPVA
jgi:AraC family transcriptional regulator